MLIKLKKAQSTAEYAILISVVIGAALAMQVFIKRSLQAKMHDSGIVLTKTGGDITGDGDRLDITISQYEPDYSSSYSRITTTVDKSQKQVRGGDEATSVTERKYRVDSSEDYIDYTRPE